MDHAGAVRLLLCLAIVASVTAFPAQGSSHSGDVWLYEGAGVVVSSFDVGAGKITVVDNGAVVCRDTNRDGTFDAGTGGMCVPFEALYRDEIVEVTEDNVVVHHWANALEVLDADLSHGVVFQVCVDVNRDNVCQGPREANANQPVHAPPCDEDVVFYSHSDAPSPLGRQNRNPLHIPDWVEGHYHACAYLSLDLGPAFAGYVIMICAGFHDDDVGSNPHVHGASHGSARAYWTEDTTSGDYCGAPTAAKAYTTTREAESVRDGLESFVAALEEALP